MLNEELAKDKGANVGNGDVISRCELENCQTSLAKVLSIMTEMRTSCLLDPDSMVSSSVLFQRGIAIVKVGESEPLKFQTKIPGRGHC